MKKYLDRIHSHLLDVALGYEPVLVRSVLVALFIMLAAFGVGSGDLPQQVDAVLVFLTFVAPIVGGWLSRRRVSPTAKPKHEALLPDDPYAA